MLLGDKQSYCELCRNTSCSDQGTRNIHFMDHNKCCNFTDGKILDSFVKIPGGKFIMGNDRYSDTSPEREVTIKPFYMAKYLVTNEEFNEFFKTGKIECSANDITLGHHPYNHPKKPIAGVSQIDAKAYAKYRGARLPTEAEWEYVARLGETLDPPLGEIAWYYENANGMTHQVGLKDPNELGIYDMFGNVYEHIEDDYYGYVNASTDGSARINDPPEDDSVIRGSFYHMTGGDFQYFCRSRTSKMYVGKFIGIRLVKDI